MLWGSPKDSGLMGGNGERKKMTNEVLGGNKRICGKGRKKQERLRNMRQGDSSLG